MVIISFIVYGRKTQNCGVFIDLFGKTFLAFGNITGSIRGFEDMGLSGPIFPDEDINPWGELDIHSLDRKSVV